jgi:signal transduction histidine kinase
MAPDDCAADCQRGSMPALRHRVGLLLALCLAIAGLTGCLPTNPGAIPGVQRIDSAVFISDRGETPVRLPHQVAAADVPQGGGRARYRLQLDLPPSVKDPAIYVPKLSRSGRLTLNGDDVGACGPRPLEELRCHHQPQYFAPVRSDWKDGRNELEFEIHLTPRQANGLSEVYVGPSRPLFHDAYRGRMFLQVDLIDLLSWLTLGLGLLSLLYYGVFRSRRLYLWFGLTCIANAASNLNHLVTISSLDYLVVDWFMFSTRLVYTALLGLTFLAFFDRDRPAFIFALCAYAALSPVVVWLYESRPAIVSLLYMPLQATAVVLAGAALRWAWQSGKRGDWAMALTFLVMPLAGALDLARLRGDGAFTGIYLLVYTGTITLVLIGLSLSGVLAVALRTTRDLSRILEGRIKEREASLGAVYERLLKVEQARARADEREQMVRDMHDGVMSTLAVTRVALNSGKVEVGQAAQYLAECLDDLRLTLAVSGNTTGSLEELLAEFAHRFGSRVEAAGIAFRFSSNLEGTPAMVSSQLLQLMRIVQEAASNAIRHSGASEIRLTAEWLAAEDQVMIEVADNGQWARSDPKRTGRGLPNMRKRAAVIGGALSIDTPSTGTCVRIRLPVKG